MTNLLLIILVPLAYQAVLYLGSEALWRAGLWKLNRNLARREPEGVS